MTLLPFLDLLFAAIGIFLILIFQALTSGAEPRATAADLVLICDAAPQVGWLEPGGEVLALDRAELIRRIEAWGQRTGRGPRVILGLTGAGIHQARALSQMLSALGGVRDDARRLPAPRVVQRPLPADTAAQEQLVHQWLGAPGREVE